MIAAATARRPVELLGFIGQETEPGTETEAVTPLASRLERLKSAVGLLEVRARRLEAENGLSLSVWREASSVFPDLFIGVLPPYWVTFDTVMRSLDHKVRELDATTAWVLRIPIWIDTGVARFEFSETVPGDLDLYIDPDAVPEAPRTLVTSTLQGTQVLAVPGIISLVLALAYGADALIEQQRATRSTLDVELYSDLLQRRKEGRLTKQEEFLFRQLTDAWRRAAEAKRKSEGPSVFQQIPSLVKWGIVGGIAFGVINITLRILELKRKK